MTSHGASPGTHDRLPESALLLEDKRRVSGCLRAVKKGRHERVRRGLNCRHIIRRVGTQTETHRYGQKDIQARKARRLKN